MSLDHAPDLAGDGESSGSATAHPLIDLNKATTLTVSNWEGRIRCVYLNDFRVAGSKPWGGGSTAASWTITLRDVVRAFPELQRALGVDYLGNPVAGAQRSELAQPPADARQEPNPSQPKGTP